MRELSQLEGSLCESEYESFTEVLRLRAKKNGGERLYTFLKDGEDDAEHLTYIGLHQAAESIGAALHGLFPRGSRIVLLFPAGLNFIKAFFGCLYAGLIAVPLPLPSAKEASISLLMNVIEKAEALGILTGHFVLKHQDLERLSNIKVLELENLSSSAENGWKPPDISHLDIAFLQYTSGSTGAPKGVKVSHECLLYNQKMIQLAFGTHGKTVFVSWLPHYHDMGLVGMILHPLYAGCQLVLMSPMAFLQKPIRWLQALSTYRGTVSGAPNFAYELCLNRIPADEIKKLNLTPWTLAFNGAEKVSAETIQRFSKAFSEAGFLEKSFFPTYGLAEATLFVSGPGVGMGPSYFMFENRQIVSVGQPWLNEEIVIVEPEFSRLQQHDEVGEIWVKGPAVPIGYWNQPLETLSTFRAYLAPDSIRAGAGPFLRTGDLGFLHNGQLYVTGRIKDVIIIHGRNIYPDDIERRALCVDAALKIASGAAFSVDFEGDEKIVLLQEVEREALKRLHPEEIVKKIKLEIIQNFEVRLYAVVLMMPYRLPKTTSGKVRRQAAKALFLANKVIEGEIYRSQMQGECPPC